MKLSDEERQAYGRYQDDLHYQASMVESTYTAGMMKGEEKGIEKGRREGEAIGRQEEKKAIAFSLLQSGLLDIEKIAVMTGLTPEVVKGLKTDQSGT
ncbi:MAG: hypothetical protein ACL93V_05155 [Candidatus Electrothrix sp. YB6]